MQNSAGPVPRAVVTLEGLRRLIPLLERRGYQVAGPTVRDGAIVYETLKKLEDLPAGWTDEQEAGRYRLKQREDAALFGYNVGPQSWKKFLHPSTIELIHIERNGEGVRVLNQSSPPPHYAFLGVRACELAAIRVQDRVLLEDRFADPVYASRRRGVFMVAVQCTRAAPTCFCASMQCGPRARQDFDLALTEIADKGRHLFVVEAGSAAGAEILREMDPREASPALCQEADEAVERAAVQTRQMDTAGIRDLLYQNFEHPRWDHVAARCLTCANCTMVCPTCFCTVVEDVSDVTGSHAERWRRWDSCFTQAFSYIHGGSVRPSVKSRYRQWMTHKLASWIDQFGSSGCVGCGRCITWCPAGIDITEEVRAIRGGSATSSRAL
ncbi:MAG: 4Fe-4S dicluster domain-containing protein [Acidobacteriia bacterium]|nr:4Fe-4S dicluster domain-containing protein [Terriglobia bacterium]